MSLQFIFGNSGSGKSYLLYQKIIEESRRYPERNYLVIVPEQFTMQTQRDLVMLHPDGGIMNIDVLSFRRLAHRVFEEVGTDRRTVLSETGKNLMLRRVAEQCKDELNVLGARMNRTGYVSEVKSILSELMQYEITDFDLQSMTEAVQNRPLLRAKLEDIRVLYRAFLDYQRDRFMKPEELMEVLAQAAGRSKLLAGSVLAFDGFAGFTPAQLTVMRELEKVCPKIYLTVTIDAREDFYGEIREHELFAPSRRLIKSVTDCCYEVRSGAGQKVDDTGIDGETSGELFETAIILGPGAGRGQACGDSGNRANDGDDLRNVVPATNSNSDLRDRLLPRFRRGGALRHLEQNLFRKKQQPYSGSSDEISLHELYSPVQEVHFVARTISGLVRNQGYRYRDIAVIAGDLGAYGNYVKRIFPTYDIPVFVDETRQLLLNPCLEFVRGALAMVQQDFSYETVFRFLRTQMAGFSSDEIDRLENYVIAAGIRGRARWEQEWTWCPPQLAQVEVPVDPAGFSGDMETGRNEFIQGADAVLNKGGTVQLCDAKAGYGASEHSGGSEKDGRSNGSCAGESMEEDGEESGEVSLRGLSLYNSLRVRFMERVGSFAEKMREKNRPLLEYAQALYQLLTDCEVQQQLKNRENELRSYAVRKPAETDPASGYRTGERRASESMAAKQTAGSELASEYRQVYSVLIDLLDEMAELLGEERMDCREFSEILDAGLSEAKIGIIPPEIDQVQVGDIRRSRLANVKVLFFLGLNDGWVPSRGDGGGIVSDTEREILLAAGANLAPSARENSYIQRFYLYQNLTKPQDRLYLSWCLSSGEGQAMRPSYLVSVFGRLFPNLRVNREPDAGTRLTQVTSKENGMLYLLHGLQELQNRDGAWMRSKNANPETEDAKPIAEDANPETEGVEEAKPVAEGARETLSAWLELYRRYLGDGSYRERVRMLAGAAFLRGELPDAGKLEAQTAKELYLSAGPNGKYSWMSASVTRLEQFAGCAFSHFVSYGLRLQERAEYGVKAMDLGNLFHEAIELFSRQMLAEELDFGECPYEEQARRMDRCVDLAAQSYEGGILYGSAREEYTIRRLKRILRRTVWVMREQMRAGRFRPAGTEISFADTGNLDAVHVSLGENGRIRLQGRIDRIDTVETEDTVYVKVVDYKSGMAQFDPVALYYGLQLQLVVYLNAALEMEEKLHPNKRVVPAGIFYHRLQDPILNKEENPEQARRTILKKMRANGLVNSDELVMRLLDANLEGDSLVIPVGMKKDGTLKAASSIATTEQFSELSGYVSQILVQMGSAILGGNIEARPFADRNQSACDYCPYPDVCGYDRKIPGRCEPRKPQLRAEEVWERLSQRKDS
ncbi:MAG: exodeoxyribonuclease V subunit gamma [Lachnospiraceae bacterium]|nr:exodeoxyribonuclease V subunit gamma [Lachnospiraceae bacterium]